MIRHDFSCFFSRRAFITGVEATVYLVALFVYVRPFVEEGDVFDCNKNGSYKDLNPKMLVCVSLHSAFQPKGKRIFERDVYISQTFSNH